ncbi:unnamed protein product [Arabis nemorensis]|uniref:Isopenicillin N synthase-like Fe(2+) 2OG dioxygenase domain-containing protein n=1 Tax=Arabis nemorensis TaxID=586526 RepID=A0A565BR92_9BRAS|nr:unnamed protein product [Arabis nemorensis]
MATDFKSLLPVIGIQHKYHSHNQNISPLLVKCDDFDMMEDAGVAEVVRKLDRACRDVGFLSRVQRVDGRVRNSTGDWISAITNPGSFICNIGDMLKILSNGVYEATLHRVINNSPRDRVCIAFFYETNFDAMVEPLDIFKEKYPENNKSQVVKRVVYGEHLVNKVQTTFANLVEHN